MSLRLLLVEDDRALRATLVAALRVEGHTVLTAASLSEGLALLAHAASTGAASADPARPATAAAPAPFDAVLLDLGLPDGDGETLLRALRRAHALPVLVISAREAEGQKVRLLDAGADDYLVKPFDLDEMLARINAIQRRLAPPTQLQVHGISIDLNARRAWRGDERIDLTGMEWAVFTLLARHPGRIYSRGELEDNLVSSGLGSGESNTLEVIVSRLRKKLGADAISTHRGLGYRLDV
jgi:DNA-binding response OmpR family regulator